QRRCVLTYYAGSDYTRTEIPTDVLKRREHRAEGDTAILWHPELAREDQYRPPSEMIVRNFIPSYVRHVARLRECQHEDGVTQVASVKVYRVEHRILSASQWKISQPFNPNT